MTEPVLPSDPWILFAEWLAVAKEREPSYPDAMMLATVGADGVPAVRAMLMKSFDPEGIVFYTNRESRKGDQLSENAKAGVCFYWKSLECQVRLEGMITKISDADSDAYFATRPRDSQLGAWASQQSRPLESRDTLLERVRNLDKEYEGRDVPRPPHWGGYRLAPSYFEFWEEGDFRLHNRFAYRLASGAWTVNRLNP
jgi:pyridoxamine 5'-phosphate oxidase